MTRASNHRFLFALLMTLALGLPGRLTAQEKVAADSAKSRKASFLAIPIAFYTPETRFGLGAAGIYAFRFRGEQDSSLVSQVQLGFAYTQNKQILSYLPFRLYWNQENFLAYGELGYYRYNFYYFGIGNPAVPIDRELYDITFPRVQLNFLRRISGDWYGGLRYWMDAMDITRTEPGGELAQGNIPGSSGSLTSGLGLVSNVDARDNVFFPRKGVFLESALLFHGRLTGSEYAYRRFSLDLSHYRQLPWGHVLAGNAFTDLTWGDVPFTQMAQLGGTKKMRGYYQGRFRDKKLMLLQAEYRASLFWRIGMVAFASWGMVAAELDEFALANSQYTIGSGLRVLLLDREQLHLRLDYGWGPGGGGFYLTVGEAF